MDYQVWLMFSDRDFSIIGYVPKKHKRLMCSCAVVAFNEVRPSNGTGEEH